MSRHGGPATADDVGHVPWPTFHDNVAPERRWCACGEDVRRSPYEPVQTAIGRHNRLPSHRYMTARWEREVWEAGHAD